MTISYAIKPLLYTTKYGVKVLLLPTIIVISYTSEGTLYVVASMYYIPHSVSKILEECKGKDKNIVRYKIATLPLKILLNLMSGAMYVILYLSYSIGKVLYKNLS